MTREELRKITMLVWERLYQLQQAVERMLQPTCPQTPLPRPRIFWLGQGIRWPDEKANKGIIWNATNDPHAPAFSLSLPSSPPSPDKHPPTVVEVLVKSTKYQPCKLYRLLRRIEAAIQWCEARRQGRLRMAQEILRQQEKYVDLLKSELTLNELEKLKL